MGLLRLRALWKSRDGRGDMSSYRLPLTLIPKEGPPSSLPGPNWVPGIPERKKSGVIIAPGVRKE